MTGARHHRHMNSLRSQIMIRPAYADDQRALHRLAALDSAAVPASPLLVAEVDGELVAALSLHDRVAVADPFRPTADIVALLRAHAATATPAPRVRRRRPPQLGLARG
jgi:hypothetical protein